MARTKKFNETRAIKAATMLFWKQGYSKTSVQGLMRVMNIGEGSFYNTYKSKKNLFIICLDFYSEVLTKDRYEALSGDLPIKERITNYFDVIFDTLVSSKGTYGCLMSNSLTFEILKDKILRKIILQEIEGFKDFLIDSFENAINIGELPRDFNSLMVASSLATYIHGVFKIATTTSDFDEMRQQAKFLLRSFGL